MTASIRLGPSPRLARASARSAAMRTAIISLPSTCSPGIPAAIAFCTRVAAAVCFSRGTEIAQPWLLITKTAGVYRKPRPY